MQKKILLQNQEIDCRFQRSRRARRLRLSISCDGGLAITMPWWSSENTAEKFIYEKAAWIIEKTNYFKKFANTVILSGNRNDYQKHRYLALKQVQVRVSRINQIYGFSLGKITIRNQKTRWGSCSRKGNLSFNYRIIFLPDQLADYLVAHELCHIQEFNHSKLFWELVSRAVPDSRKRAKELRKYI